ncbi:hypothetical protein TRFO_33332 [Tritrichomonas foetus]|uniref:USP domain-containing protein n=1 Tax=Tritrichomonas foetus TaxID=1144522 RepID=A0A1J4JLR8_9EUKA|nr:hypothetical protein TRFO_33332 [Tritrichomonas foetus]|eukprot:OHT00047.1 hypothetical protein TRFO_33332 [Tritrichomonas foetus]
MNNNYVYKLVAVSQHIGSLHGGHYTAQCMRENEWFTFNDRLVQKSNFVANEIASDKAYLLFYTRV